MTGWELFVGLLGAYVIFPFACGPFLARKNLRLSKPLHYHTVADKDVPYSVYERLQETRDDLETLGYYFVGYGAYDTPLPYTTVHCGIFRHDDNQSLAVITGRSDQTGTLDVYEEILSPYASGMLIATNNAATLAPYQTPQKRHYRFPDVVDVQQLHAMHQWIVEHSSASHDACLPSPGEELLLLYQGGIGEVTWHEQHGSLYWDQAIGHYRPTWWGALQFTLCNAFPFRQLRAYAAVLAARRAITGMPEAKS